MTDKHQDFVVFDGSWLTLENIHAIAHGEKQARLSDAPAFCERIEKGSRFIDQLLAEDGVVYGVTTGYGDSCTVEIPP
ncbi:aromatic amino acid lyase, partial [Chromobacterium sphagni]